MIDECSDFHGLFGLPDQGVRAICTTRWHRPASGRIRSKNDQDFNLSAHVGDDPRRVLSNRALLLRRFNLPAEPVWLDQVHGTNIHKVVVPKKSASLPVADGATTRLHHQVLAVLTADCLPLVLATLDGAQVAAVHVGWLRGSLGLRWIVLMGRRWRLGSVRVLGPAILKWVQSSKKTLRQTFFQRTRFQTNFSLIFLKQPNVI